MKPKTKKKPKRIFLKYTLLNAYNGKFFVYVHNENNLYRVKEYDRGSTRFRCATPECRCYLVIKREQCYRTNDRKHNHTNQDKIIQPILRTIFYVKLLKASSMQPLFSHYYSVIEQTFRKVLTESEKSYVRFIR